MLQVNDKVFRADDWCPWSIRGGCEEPVRKQLWENATWDHRKVLAKGVRSVYYNLWNDAAVMGTPCEQHSAALQTNT